MNTLFTKEQVLEAVTSTTNVGLASHYLKIDRRTLKSLANKYQIELRKYKGRSEHKYDLQEILNGKYPQYPTSKLSKRLVEAGLKQYRCENCKIDNWAGKRISLELNHKDGDSRNHCLSNLELLCPNCHSQTDTYRSKKLKWKRGREVEGTRLENERF